MKKLIPALLAFAAAAPGLAEEITYSKHIRPVWEDQCERCHGASAPTYEVFLGDPKRFETDDKGPRMDTYESLLFFVNGPKAPGALMRKLDDGANSKDGQPGNMYRHLGRSDKRKANLQLFKQWVGEDAWFVKKAEDVSQEDLKRVKALN